MTDQHQSYAIVDCRDTDRFVNGHLSDAARFEWPQLKEQLFLLPDRHVPLIVISKFEQKHVICEFLQDKGYRIQQWIDELAFNANAVNDLVDNRSDYIFPTRKLIKGNQSKRLWSPCSTVIAASEYLDLAGKQVLDIGCGAGRDSVWLAAQGAEVTAIDYIADMRDKITRLAETEQVSVNFICQDLESSDNFLLEKSLNEWKGRFDMIVVVRYLNRELFPAISSLLSENGILVWHTFMQGCEQFGSPKNPNFLLAENELASDFSDMSVLMDEKQFLADGRPVNAFIARK